MKQFSVAMLGYGIAGKAFARILNQTHDEILAKTGYDVKVVAITTGSRGSLYSMDGLDLVEATRQLEEEGKFNPEYAHYSTMNSMEVVNTVDYELEYEATSYEEGKKEFVALVKGFGIIYKKSQAKIQRAYDALRRKI